MPLTVANRPHASAFTGPERDLRLENEQGGTHRAPLRYAFFISCSVASGATDSVSYSFLSLTASTAALRSARAMPRQTSSDDTGRHIF